MAKASGLGWLALGVAIGAAAVLAVQTFARHAQSASAEPPASSRMLTIAPAAALPPPSAAAPLPKVATAAEPPPSAAVASPSAAAVQDAGQVADDAAAAGMTSRIAN